MTTHHFQPTHYFNSIGSHDPVLHIAPGDHVVTTTVDAGGGGATGDRVTDPGNPQTGPFYVEGAEPGDTLVFRIEHLWPSRDHGYTATVLAENVVDPAFVRELPAQNTARWQLDREAGMASVATDSPLGKLTLPIEMMLGCFGVAPQRGQAVNTGTSGEWGGNMDYRGFKPGMTIYLPVWVPGALLHVGDAHARQGDGEIVGTGIEVSADIEFSVDLRKGWTTGWPRGEDDEFIFAVGNARPLDQALQHATTELMRWLQADYGLDAGAASLLLGQTILYDVGNVFDPAYTMVAKIAKRWLPERKA